MIQESEPQYVSLRLFTSIEMDSERIKNLIKVFDKNLSNAKNIFTINTNKKNIICDFSDLDAMPFNKYHEINEFIIESKVDSNSYIKIIIDYKYVQKNVHIEIRNQNAATISEQVQSFFLHNKIWYEIVYSNPLKFLAVILAIAGIFLPEIFKTIALNIKLSIKSDSITIISWLIVLGLGYILSYLFVKFFPLYRMNFGLEKTRLQNLTNTRNFIIGIPSALLTITGLIDIFKN